VNDEHIKHAETVGKHRAVYKRYMEQKPKTKEAFYNVHTAEIILYESVSRYLKEHLNGRTAISLKAWQAERVKLTAENAALSHEYRIFKTKSSK
jgi:hypothetical protein